MSRITVGAEYLRIARMFAVTDRKKAHIHQRFITAATYILLHPTGKTGLHVISTDGAVVCIQYDKDGAADRAYTIKIDDDTAGHLKGNTVDSRQVVIDMEKDRLRVLEGTETVFKAALCNNVRKAHIFEHAGPSLPTGENGVMIYPDWRRIAPSEEDLTGMKEGFPGIISMRYLRTIAAMYDDWLDYRDVRILHKPRGTLDDSTIYAQFPWRPQMLLIIAPLTGGEFDSQGNALEVLNPEAEDDEL